MFDINRESDPAPGSRDERISDIAEIAGDQCEEVAWLLVRIAPDGVVAAGYIGLARGFEIAVGEQDRRLGPIRLEPHPIG